MAREAEAGGVPLDHHLVDPTTATPSPLASLHKYITLPFALHIPPLPSLHYQAVPTSPSSGGSSHASLDDSLRETLDPQNSRIGYNLRLQSLVLQPPPLDLDSISFLLEVSNAAYAIQPFSQLLRLLDRADTDPHFDNLIAFFDARYDLKTGTLEGSNAVEESRTASSAGKQGMLGRMVSRSKHHSSSSASRKPSSVGLPANRATRPSASLGQSGTLLAGFRRTGSVAAGGGSVGMSPFDGVTPSMSMVGGDGESVFLDDDGEAFAVASSTGHESYDVPPANGTSSTIAPPRYAPHLVVPSRGEPGKARSIAFPIRLDLHNAGKGLCPPPPLPSSPIGGSSSKEWPLHNLAVSPTLSAFGGGGGGGGSKPASRATRRRSPSQASATEGPSSSGFASSLRRVVSPDSVASNHSRYSSHSSDQQHTGENAVSSLGRQGSVRSSHDSALRSGTTSSAGGKTQQVGSSRRRSSAISRILSFRRGKKREPSFVGSVFSGTGSSDVGGVEEPYPMDGDLEVPPVPPVPAHLLGSATSASRPIGRSGSQKGRGRDLSPLSPVTDGMGNLAISPSSASHQASSFGGATTSTSPPFDAQPYGSHMPYTSGVVEGVPFATVEEFSWAGAEAAEDGKPLDDFLRLLRKAADTALSLPRDSLTQPPEHESSPSPANGNGVSNALSDKARGKQPIVAGTLTPLDTPSSERAAIGHGGSLFPPTASPCGGSRRSSSHHSRRSVFGDADIDVLKNLGQDNAEEKIDAASPEEEEEDLFTRARKGKTSDEAEPWWPSGGVDPLPVSILSALGLAFGWKGILGLCYGPGSPITRGQNGGELAALGKAVAMAEAEKRGEEGSASTSGEAREVSGEAKMRQLRTWSDWHRLATSISKWIELYEMTRIRSGLAREIGLDPVPSASSDTQEPLTSQAQYSLSSGVIPAAVASDASTRSHAYRRRLGIPEGLPANEDGVELGDYRWSRSKLGPASAATSLTLAGASLAHYIGALDTSDLTWSSAWELDYLEALVLKSPVIAERFPAPIGRPVSIPLAGDAGGDYPRGKTCPYPRPDGSFDVEEWETWLRGRARAGGNGNGKEDGEGAESGLKGGDVLTPAVSVQAWWACIAIIASTSGDGDGDGDGGRTDAPSSSLELQILGKDEDWRDVASSPLEEESGGAVYI